MHILAYVGLLNSSSHFGVSIKDIELMVYLYMPKLHERKLKYPDAYYNCKCTCKDKNMRNHHKCVAGTNSL